MKKTVIVENEYMVMWFHPESKIIHHEVKKAMPKGEFPRLCLIGADYLEKHGAIKWLSDDRNMVIHTEEDGDFGNRVFVPRLRKAGFKYWAVVMPKGALGSIQVKRFIRENRDRGITVEAFDNPEAALAWLESK